MRYDLEFVELHAPLFIDGMNFGLKLYADPKKNKAPIKLYYDTEGTGKYTKNEHVVVEYKNKISIIETVASKTVCTGPIAVDKVITRINPEVRAQASGPGMDIKRTAQVETPLDKVQGGVKTIRRAKYQGEGTQGE